MLGLGPAALHEAHALKRHYTILVLVGLLSMPLAWLEVERGLSGARIARDAARMADSYGREASRSRASIVDGCSLPSAAVSGGSASSRSLRAPPKSPAM